jgi:hypothetical protein
MKSDIREAVRLFAAQLSGDERAAKPCFEALMRCVEARGGVKYDADGNRFVDTLVFEAVRDQLVDAIRSALVAKLAPRLEELGGREVADAATKVVHEMFEACERDFKRLSGA